MLLRRSSPLRLLLGLLTAVGCVGCATFGEQGQPLVPTRYQARTGPFAVFSNVPIAADAPAIRSLLSLETDIESSLGLRVRAEEPAVEVYILNDRQSFMHFLKFYYPELPQRRAFFLAQGAQRVVFTFMGDRLEEDLRHECTHALLNVASGDLPLWLDEGLAEYFEGPDNRHGLNPEHLDRLPHDLASGWKPDLARLETLKTVREMSPRDYRESWAWVHYLLNGTAPGKAALLAYLGDLRSRPDAAPLSDRLRTGDWGGPGALVAHIDRARTEWVAKAPSPSEPTLRFQDVALDSSRTSGPRRSLFGRLRSFFGL
jgi:hypothetical protein